MKKFVIKTHGCKTNQLESAIMREKLLDAGYCEVSKFQDADVYILNSCTVTSNSDDEAFRNLRHVKNVKPEIISVLSGCVAQLLKKNYTVDFPYIDILIGNDDKFKIVELLTQHKSSISDIFSLTKFNNQFIHKYAKTRGYLKIQDGCDNYCSYCTIPYARGRSRSNSIENIIEQIKIFHNAGIKEVVLTGIHIGQWGCESDMQLKDLLISIENTDIQRYRLGSLNPLELNDDLINFLSGSEKFCPHFHLSLQSLCDRTLKNMNRHYNAMTCLNLIDKLNDKFVLPFIGSDIIAGFPDESEKDFQTTLSNAQSSGLSNIHVFPYSLRKSTPAENLPNHHSLAIKKMRADELKAVAQNKYNEFVMKNVNVQAEVLVEKRPDKLSGRLKGVTKNYLNVLINSSELSLLNTIQTAKIVKFENNNLFCNII